ncbi:hypothetical protein BPJM79_30048 [Bacillus pumilus]
MSFRNMNFSYLCGEKPNSTVILSPRTVIDLATHLPFSVRAYIKVTFSRF